MDDVVVIASDSTQWSFCAMVRGLNAKNGQQLWEFKPDTPTWNFGASFPGDGTLVFQDMEGKAYRLKIQTGELIWKVGGNRGTWTDGTLTLGPDNVVYAVATKDWQGRGHKYSKGDLWAYQLSDGKLLWHKDTNRVPNVAPGVGKLYKKDKFSVVQATGQQVLKGGDTYVEAFDAATGEFQWKFDGPLQKGDYQAGDLEGVKLREAVITRGMCLPNPWSAPTIDAAGTVYIANQDGVFFALRDVNGDGKVEGPDEVSSYDALGSFAGSAAPSLAPGMVVVASCDTLFMFKEPKGKST
eukprot:UN1251